MTYRKPDSLFVRHLTHRQSQEITELLLGHSVVSTDWEHQTLTLDNGVTVEVEPNEGCGGCTNGLYDLTALSRVDNIITKVEVVSHDIEDDDTWFDTRTAYEVFVFAGDERINLFTVQGTDGNGYYGTGYSLTVRLPKHDL